jgi:alpha-ketoglutarate-dependent taurine dioxygenase
MARIELTSEFGRAFEPLDTTTSFVTRDSCDVSAVFEPGSHRCAPSHTLSALQRLGAIIRTQLKTVGFVHLKGLPDFERLGSLVALSHAVGKLFDDLAYQETIVVQASPRPQANLQGNQTEPLPLHTDYSMLQLPPAVTVLWCRKEDPAGPPYGSNGLCSASELSSAIHGTALMERLESTEFIFGGKRGSSETVSIKAPILRARRSPDELSHIRFHPSRIFFGHRAAGVELTRQQLELMSDFRSLCQRFRRDVWLEKGDLLFVNNRAVLHDRSECSLKWSGDSFESRVTEIAFIQEMHNDSHTDGA